MNILSTKAHYLLLFVPLFVIISCNDDEIVYPEGGYKYPKHVEDKDTTFYSYPLNDVIAPFDTIKNTETYHLLRLFDEYNLSLKPAKTTIFRFIYIGWGDYTIINLTPTEIIVKRHNRQWKYPLYDKTKLNEKEKEDFYSFEFLVTYSDHTYYAWQYFDSLRTVSPKLLNIEYYKDLLNKVKHGDKTFFAKQYKHDFDSLTKLNPRLLNSRYYKELLDKSTDPGSDKFEYSTNRIPISKKTFTHLVNLINESGYWQLPYETNCEFVPTDASDFILEANTPKKYKFVTSVECPNNITKYTKACQELIKYAKADDKIRLIWSGAATTDTPIVKPNVNKLKLIDIKEETKPKKKKAK